MQIEDTRRSALTAPKSRPFTAELTGAETDFLTIGDISRIYSLSLRALRFYEERGLLVPVRRGVTRLYDPRSRARLELILKGKQLGFTLTEIRSMIETAEDGAGQESLALAPAQVLEQICMLEKQRHDLDVAIEELRATHLRLLDADAGELVFQSASVAA
ncbi:MAG: HTH-type transcriptional regulator CueR [Hyphomicrobiales bacterium]|nr:HTH-type transcriptional regulator CueR [Hyphomicrobiales bacterium]